MSVQNNNQIFSIRAINDIDAIVASLKDVTETMTFGRHGCCSEMEAVGKTLIQNVDRSHYKQSKEAVLAILESAQKLVIKGEGASYRLGPEVVKQMSTDNEVSNGLASAPATSIDNVNGDGARVGTLNYDIWERNSYRKKLYFKVYGKIAPDLPDFTREDPFQVDEPALNPKTYTEAERYKFDKWLAASLKGSVPELESLVFSKIDDNIDLKHWQISYDQLEAMSDAYAKILDDSRELIKELILKEKQLDVINQQIKELENT
jgi:hypothetical protein